MAKQTNHGLGLSLRVRYANQVAPVDKVERMARRTDFAINLIATP